ncbi:hypothetical protein AB0H71_17550 [Nocardia sp. NPDC050697]|uniref:nucleotide exchange factor GrpE n=1 Tax=Nocardia sp. NPDC050697 TaxID=3155158 RepID=UPI003400A978
MTHPDSLAAPGPPAIGQVLHDLTDEIRRLNDRSERLEAVNTRMHEHLAALEGDLLRASLRPVIKALAEIHGDCVHTAQHVRGAAGAELARALAGDSLAFAARIEDILEGLGAVAIGVEVGDPFDRRIHQLRGTRPTAIEAEHDRVSAIHHQGFRHVASDRPVIHAKVTIWKFAEDLPD